ncbi:DegT/DnrJ/EryC1/StrS family aminotransferase [Colwellia piezophila]|uniref:DegT/DnrJ/EryC1/StrS family aminotransferase n=1 Tax=Colwellia piezophila TaxID=211668 RepID=UPI00036E6812|nr:DegT/DnrJ/EryC1/StrS family aminotransferase [Colwellia piezophila]
MRKIIKPEVAYWGNKEWLSIMKNILCARVCQGKAIPKLQLSLEQEYPDSQVILLNSARAGLVLSLQVFQRYKPEKREVLIPEFICDSVPSTIKDCGLIPVYVPVKADLNLDVALLDHFCNYNTLAVILPHMYAKPADIIQAEAIVKAKGVYLIDDAAQVAGIKLNGKALGSFGDVGILSFAQAKTIVTGVRASGGVLFINNKRLMPALSVMEKNLPESAGRVAALGHFLLAYKWQGFAKALDYYWQRLRVKFTGKAIGNFYFPVTRISNLDADIALAQFESLPTRIALSKRLIKHYQKKMKHVKDYSLVQCDTDDLYLTRLIIQSKKMVPEKLAAQLQQGGIITKFVYGSGSKAFDGSVTSGLLELPLQNLSFQQLDRVINTLKYHSQKES